MKFLSKISVPIIASAIVLFAKIITAVRGIWQGCEPTQKQRVYYANHGSNGDFVLIWSVLPPALRAKTRPVAGSDYWLSSRLKAFIGKDVFKAVLIDRNKTTRKENPIEIMSSAIKKGDSLILFPEGTRNTTDEALLPFKPGLYHLASQHPDVELVPTWIDNLTSVMPKGEIIPVPLLCTVSFGTPVYIKDGEEKSAFLKRLEMALIALKDEVQK